MPGDHPDIPYIQAKRFGEGRPDGPPLWIVWHTMEEDELPDTAERVARYFATLSDDRTVSAHYCVDANSDVQCVRTGDVAWTVGNRAGNYRGISIELAGRAAQTPAQWADPYSTAMLRRACRIAARDMARYAIPARWCTIEDLHARRPGMTTHNDCRIAFGGTTHTDPGPGFPRDLVLALVAGGEEQSMVSTDDVYALIARNERVEGSATSGGGVPIAALNQYAYRAMVAAEAGRAEVTALRAVVEQLAAVLSAGGVSVDTAAVLAGVDERLAALRQVVEDDVRDAVADLAEGGSAAVRADEPS